MVDHKTFRPGRFNAVQKYYSTIESRVGYRLFLNDNRHFPYYERDTFWPFPLWQRADRMTDQVLRKLDLEPGAHLLDAGCGVGVAAVFLGNKGYRVQGIDATDIHVEKAARLIQRAGLASSVSIERGDYQYLPFEDNTFDGVYAVETFVHTTEPERALSEFLRVLKPGGRLVIHDYDRLPYRDMPPEMAERIKRILHYVESPSMFERGGIERRLSAAGFEDVQVDNYSRNIVPALRLFFLVAWIPYMVFAGLGIMTRFMNTVMGVDMYRTRRWWRYIAVSARKSDGKSRPRRKSQ